MLIGNFNLKVISTGYRLEGPKWSFAEKATNKGLEHGTFPSNIIDQGYPMVQLI